MNTKKKATTFYGTGITSTYTSTFVQVMDSS